MHAYAQTNDCGFKPSPGQASNLTDVTITSGILSDLCEGDDFKALSDITISEVANGLRAINGEDTGLLALLLELPEGLEFNRSSVVTVTTVDIKYESINIQRNAIFLFLSGAVPNKIDEINISGIEVRAVEAIPGEHEISISTAIGCVNGIRNGSTVASTITVLPSAPQPTLSFASGSLFCKGDEIRDGFLTVTSAHPLQYFSDEALTNEITSIADRSQPTAAELGFDAVEAGSQAAYVLADPAGGCRSKATKIEIEVVEDPVLDLSALGGEICPGDLIRISLRDYSNGSISWVNSNPAIGLSTSGGEYLYFTAALNNTSSPQNATVEVTAVVNGCEVKDQIHYTLIPGPAIGAFSPAVEICDISSDIDLMEDPRFHINLVNAGDRSKGSFTFSGKGIVDPRGIFNASNETWQKNEFVDIDVTFTREDGCQTTRRLTLMKVISNPTVRISSPVDGADLCRREPVELKLETNEMTSEVHLATSGKGAFSGTFNNALQVQTYVYSPAPDDLGEVTITATTNNPGAPCSIATDQVTLRVFEPVVAQLADLELCPAQALDALTFTSLSMPDEGEFSWSVGDQELLGLVESSGTGSLEGIVAAANTTGMEKFTEVTVIQQVNGCSSAPMKFRVVVKPQPVAAQVESLTVCPGEDVLVNLSSSPASSETTYQWSSTNAEVGLADASGTGSRISFKAANPGTEPVSTTVHYTASLNECESEEKSFVINVKPQPQVASHNDIVLCGGEQVVSELGSTVAGATFSWTIDNPTLGMPASGSGNLDFPTEAHYGKDPVIRTVRVRASKDDCTGAESTFNILLKPLPKVDSQEKLVILPGQEIPSIAFSDNSGGNSTFSWSATNALETGLSAASGNGALPAFTAPDNTTGASITATVSVWAAWNECESDTEMKFDIELKPRPQIAEITNRVVCPGELVEVTFKADVEGTRFRWTNDNTDIGLGASASGDISFTPTANFGTTARVATIRVTPESAAGVVGDPVAFTITVKPVPVINTQARIELCPGEELEALSFTSSMSDQGEFHWEVGDKTLLGLSSHTGTGSLSGIKAGANNSGGNLSTQVTVTQTVEGCTSQEIKFDVVVKPQPELAQENNLVLCPGDDVVVNFSSSPNRSATVYEWTSSNTAVGLAASGTGALSFKAENPKAELISTTIYYTAILNECESVEKSFTIAVKPQPQVASHNDIVVCGGEQVVSALSSTVAGATFSWSIDNPVLGMPSSGSGDLNFTSEPQYGEEAIVRTVRVRAASEECTGPDNTFNLIIKPLPKVAPQDDIVIRPGQAVEALRFSDNSGGESTFSWSATNADAIGLPATSGHGTLPAFTAKNNTTGASIFSTIKVTAAWNDCESNSDSEMEFRLELKPQPVMETVEPVIVCPGENVSAVFTADLGGTTYSWTNTNPEIGLPASGTGSLSFAAAENFTTSAKVATIRVTPESADRVAGAPVEFAVTVKPVPVINPQNTIELCPGEEAEAIAFTSSMTEQGVFNWEVADKELLGLSSNTGTASLSGIKAAANNIGRDRSTQVSVTQTIDGCTSQAMKFTVVVKAQPVTTQLNNLALCPGEEVAINFAANTNAENTIFAWKSSNPALGLAESGTGPIGFAVPENLGTADISSTITYTALLNGCESEEKSFVIRVRPQPVVSQPADILICSGELARTSFRASLTEVSYSWTIEDPVLGMPASGTGNLNFATEPHFGGEDVERTVKVKAMKAGCVSEEKSFKLILKPKPQLVQQADLVIFPGEPITSLPFADNSGENSQITWTASNASLIGLPANNGSGALPAFTANDNTSGGTIESSIIVNARWNGCESAPMQFTIQLRPRPILAPMDPVTACPGEPVDLAFEANVSGTTFKWTNTNPGIGLPATGNGDLSFIAGENFIGEPLNAVIRVIPVSPDDFEGKSVELLITIQPVPVTETVEDIAVCPGELVNIDFAANTTETIFYWENDNTLSGLAQNGEGNFWFRTAENFSGSQITSTVTYFAHRQGCESEAKTFTITIKNQPVPEPVAAVELCSAETFAPAAFSDDTDGNSLFSWSIDGAEWFGLAEASGTGNLPHLTAVDNFTGAPVTITITYYSTLDGCRSESLSYPIVLLPAPVLLNTDVFACANESLDIQLQPNTAGGESFSWESSNPAIGFSDVSGDGDRLSFTALNETEEVQRTTITVSISREGCTYPGQTFDIVVKPLPAVSNPASELMQQLCSGDALVFEPVSPLEGVQFSWTASSDLELEGFTASGQGPLNESLINHHNTTARVIYTITPVREDEVECAGEPVELVVYIAPVPDLQLPQTEYSVCNGETLNILPGSVAGIDGTTYEWTVSANASGAVSGSGTEISQQLSNEANEADIITYTIRAIAGDCRSEEQQVTVYVRPYATVNAGEDFALCAGEPIVLEGVIGGSATYATWSGGLGSFQNAAALVTTYTPDPSEIGTSIQLFLTTNKPSGPCSAAVDTVNINIEALPDLAIVNLPGVYCTQNDPFLLEGYPANGTFSGEGVVFNEETKRYYYDPKVSGLGLYRVTYSFTNSQGCTGYASGLIDVSSGANPDFNVLSSQELICETQSSIGLTPLVQGGVFEGPGVEIIGGRAWFNPAQAEIGENLITYTIFDQKSGCTTSSIQTLYVSEKPVVSIEYENLCVGNSVKFRPVEHSISEGDEIVSYNWNFGDGYNATDASPVRQFSRPGIHEVSLTVQTALGCEPTEIRQQVVVSNIVELDIEFENICGNEATSFRPRNIEKILNFNPSEGVILSYSWDFGDPASGAANFATEAQSSHRFSDVGEYEVRLTVRTSLGCEETVSRMINIVPTITSFPYLEQFTEADNKSGWFAEGDSSSWEYAMPSGKMISNAAVAGTYVWATSNSATQGYNNSERSFLVSPCFDLASFEQPMISMNMFVHTEKDRDGAVLEYSTDSGKNWDRLGNTLQGLNWYKSTNITANPDGKGIGNQGWSEEGNEWKEVAYSLEGLNASSVMFRIVFASDNSNPVGSMFEGIAVDNIYVGSRNKKVLVENFTNTRAAGFESNVKSFGALAENTGLQDDVVLLQYHTAFPQPDSVYMRNPEDNSARALYYGIYEAPQLIIDGLKVEDSERDTVDRKFMGKHTMRWIERQSLSKPAATIDIMFDLAEAHLLKGMISVTPLSPIEQELILYINAVEVEAGNGALLHRNVLKKIMPESSGSYLNGLTGKQEIDFEWHVSKDFEPGKLGVVAYLQEKGEKNVLQSSFKVLNERVKAGKLTATGDINAALKKIEVYPNPADDFIRLKTNREIGRDLHYEIIHLDGTTIAKGRLAAGLKEYEIESHYLYNGMYILRVFTEKSEPAIFKVMVMHRK